MRPVLGGVAGCDGDACAEGSLDEVEAAGENEQLDTSCSQQEAGTNEGIGDTRKQKVEVWSLGGRINATHRKISKAAGTGPRMISDAIRDDLLDGIEQFVSKVCSLSTADDILNGRGAGRCLS